VRPLLFLVRGTRPMLKIVEPGRHQIP